MKNINSSLRGLYAISDEFLTPIGSIEAQVEFALIGGAKIFQLRDKQSSDRDLLNIAEKLRDLCAKYDAVFIINDRADLAKELGAGVHLGFSDYGVKKARDILGGGAVIGVSCYGDKSRAIEAQENGADYVSFGACFRSPTKPAAKVLDNLEIFEGKELYIPICAIGGITSENARSVIKAGASMIAVISSLWSAKDLVKTAQDFQKLFEVKN